MNEMVNYTQNLVLYLILHILSTIVLKGFILKIKLFSGLSLPGKRRERLSEKKDKLKLGQQNLNARRVLA